MSTQRGQAAAWAPQRTKAVVLGCTVPSSSRKLISHLGCQMRYQLLALAFQPGVGLWGPGHPESGPRYASLLQPAGWGREDTVLPPFSEPRPADLFNIN